MAGEVKILIEAANNASKALDQVDKDIQDIDKTSQGIGKTTATTGKQVIGSWTEIASVVSIAKQGYQALQGVYKGLITDTVDYGLEVRDLSTYLGTSTEETSKLIQISDDLRIPVGQLRLGMKKAVSEGVLPNIDGIKQLAREYKALPDQLAKSQFASEKFGRAGQDMVRILELTENQIDAMAQSAEDAGLVLDEDAVAASERYYAATDQLNDVIMGLKITLGTELIPAITDVVETSGDAVSVFKDLIDITGQLSSEDEAAAVAGVKLNTAILDSFGPVKQLKQGYDALKDGLDAYHESIEPAIEATDISAEGAFKLRDQVVLTTKAEFLLRDELISHPTVIENVTSATDRMREGDSALITTLEDVNAVLQEYSIRLAFNEAAQSLDAGTALALGRELGLVDERMVALNAILPAVTEKFDTNKDGIIDTNEAAMGYLATVKDLIINLNNIPEDITTTWYFKKVNEPPGNPPAGGGGPKQHGGSVNPNRWYWVGERGPEIFVPNTAGNIVPNNQIERVTNNNRQNVNIYGGLNLSTVGNTESLLAEFAKLMP